MRYQGKMTSWKDDQGFGFVIPNGGGQKAFVHIKAFSKRPHRPTEGDMISYELATDKKGRYFAKNIHFAKDTKTLNTSNNTGSFSIIFTILFILLLAILALVGKLPLVIAVIYVTASMVAFLAYVIDKSAAKNDRWRTRESTLHLFSLIGGWPGALFAQKTLRHKSKKQEFQTTFWLTIIINCSLLGWLLVTKNGASYLSLIETFI